MPNIIGFDIGGANTKAAFVRIEKGNLIDLRTSSKYFPLWKQHERLGTILLQLKSEISGSCKIDCVSVTMTAEIADSYKTKREGVNDVLAEVEQAFSATKVLILNTNAQLISLGRARRAPLQVAAANWIATGWMVAQLVRDCIVLDIGSTTTSVIPIGKGVVKAEGKTDLEKLINGELVYTGSLRTNIAAIVQTIPMGENVARVASELFAQSGDVHLILGNISKEDYTVETADGKGKTKEEARARLARIVCADTEILNEEQIVQMAQYVYDKQIEQVTAGLGQVYGRSKTLWRKKPSVVITGLGRNFLARKAAERLGFHEVCDLEDLTKLKIAKVSTAVSASLMAATKVEGGKIEWVR